MPPTKLASLHGRPIFRYSRVDDGWLVWLTCNNDATVGTAIKLCDDSRMFKITFTSEGTEEIMEITQ